MDRTAWRSSAHLKSNASLWWRDSVSATCHHVTNHQVLRMWLLFLMILWFGRQFLCSTEYQVVSWGDYSHLESVRLEHPAWMEFNANSQLEAPLGLWTKVTTCGLSMPWASHGISVLGRSVARGISPWDPTRQKLKGFWTASFRSPEALLLPCPTDQSKPRIKGRGSRLQLSVRG